MIYVHKVEIGEIKGELKVELLNWQDRSKLIKNIVYNVIDGKLVEREELEQGEMSISATIKQVKEVDISFGEMKISTIEDLLFYKEGTVIMNQISPIILNGVSLEKK